MKYLYLPKQENYCEFKLLDITYEIIYKMGRSCANGEKRPFRRRYKGKIYNSSG